MRIAVFSTKSYDRQFLQAANERHGHELVFFEPRLTVESGKLAEDFPAVCAFVNDRLDAPLLAQLKAGGTRLIALRSAGFNHVDVRTANELGLTVVRVPAYSPYAVAEHALGMILTLNRKFHKAYNRIREGNFSLEGLLGFDLHGQTVGIVGLGKIGGVVAHIVQGFGCRVLAHDEFAPREARTPKIEFVPLDELFAQADIVSLHCPLTPQTRHMIDARAIDRMKPGVMLINTSRGALVDARAVIHGLKSGRIGYFGLDVYEEEADLFFEDLSGKVIQDDVFSRLSTFPNVLITGHQAFFTRNALEAIAEVTLANVAAYERGEPLPNEVRSEK